MALPPVLPEEIGAVTGYDSLMTNKSFRATIAVTLETSDGKKLETVFTDFRAPFLKKRKDSQLTLNVSFTNPVKKTAPVKAMLEGLGYTVNLGESVEDEPETPLEGEGDAGSK